MKDLELLYEDNLYLKTDKYIFNCLCIFIYQYDNPTLYALNYIQIKNSLNESGTLFYYTEPKCHKVYGYGLNVIVVYADYSVQAFIYMMEKDYLKDHVKLTKSTDVINYSIRASDPVSKVDQDMIFKGYKSDVINLHRLPIPTDRTLMGIIQETIKTIL
jgi:hypothetical protein